MLHLQVKADSTPAVLEEYETHRIIERSGATHGWLSVQDDRVYVVALWSTQADYDAWLTNPLRIESGQRLMPHVTALVDSFISDKDLMA